MTWLKLDTVGRRWLFEAQTLLMALCIVLVFSALAAFFCGAVYVVWHLVFDAVVGVMR